MTRTDIPDPPAPGTRSGKPRVLESSALFDSHRTVTILHQGEQYTLRLTAGNKLILTK